MGLSIIWFLPEFPVFLLKAVLVLEGQGGWKHLETHCPLKEYSYTLFRMCVCFNYAGNDSKVDGLVNFEKLRMIAKEIRQVVRMTSANMDPAVMFRQRCAI